LPSSSFPSIIFPVQCAHSSLILLLMWTHERDMKFSVSYFFYATKEFFASLAKEDGHKCPITNRTLSKPCRTLFCDNHRKRKIFPSKQPVECKSSGKDATTHMAWHMLKRHNNNSKTFSSFSLSPRSPNVKRICMLMLCWFNKLVAF
jgi:hypothetical protein